jgi:hypothetical protein
MNQEPMTLEEIEAALKRCLQSLIERDETDDARKTQAAWEGVRSTVRSHKSYEKFFGKKEGIEP